MDSLLLVLSLFLADPAPIESRFVQVTPLPPQGKLFGRSPGQERAIVLVHGLHLHPFSMDNVSKPLPSPWQEAGTVLVRELSRHGDVFAFSYGQDRALDEIIEGTHLDEQVMMLKKQGYTDIVLIGHSAGGLFVRQLVEDHPDLGVTKVIQVCTPNIGSAWAKLPLVRKNQRAFMESLTKENREKTLKNRADKVIPEKVQFVCVVGTGGGNGDGVVNLASQWPEDLQKQGIPAYDLASTHYMAMRSAKGAELLAKILGKDAPRWDALKVAAAKKEILER